MNYEHPFPRVLEYYKVSDIIEIDIMQFRVYYKVQLKYQENITHNNRRTSYTHLHNLSSCNFLCNREGSTIDMVIREVVEAKHKANKTIVLGRLRMYFHD